MNWRAYLPLAARLAAGTDEADWRSSVSRAYYAAFHVGRRLLSDLGFRVPRSDRAHQYLLFRLMNCGNPGVTTAGKELESLRKLRNGADYDDAPPFTRQETMRGMHLAQRIIAQLDAARQEPTRTQITDAIKVYERDVLHDVTWQP